METNKTGERIGDFFGTLTWLWVFHRFRMDGMVLLGFEHPWEHGAHDDHGDDDGHSSITLGSPKAKVGEATANWEKFSERATIPGEDDEDDDDDDDDDE